MALTLRLVCGLTTAEIARAFLVSEATMAARVTRAKKKIAAARIAYRVPEAAELPDRLDAVLTVVHLLFTTGHTAPTGDDLVRARPGRRGPSTWPGCCAPLMPDEREVRGLLALLLLTDARRATRTGARRPAAAARGAGPGAVGPGRHRGGRRAGPRGAARRPARPVRAAGRDRRAARRGAELRRDRLAAGARRSTTCCCASGRRRWSRSTGRWLCPWWTGPAAALAEVDALEGDGRLAGYRYLQRPRPTCCAGSGAGPRRPQAYATPSPWPRTRKSADSSLPASPRWSRPDLPRGYGLRFALSSMPQANRAVRWLSTH